jgi:hypothetical protein
MMSLRDWESRQGCEECAKYENMISDEKICLIMQSLESDYFELLGTGLSYDGSLVLT